MDDPEHQPPELELKPLPPDAEKLIEDVTSDVRDALHAVYSREGELRARMYVDGLRDTITIHFNGAVDLEEELGTIRPDEVIDR